MLTEIKTLADVKSFAEHLITVEKVNTHPDDDFFDYVNYKTKAPIYSNEEALLRNRLMEECFEVCQKENADVYDIMVEVLQKEIGIDKFIAEEMQAQAA